MLDAMIVLAYDYRQAIRANLIVSDRVMMSQ